MGFAEAETLASSIKKAVDADILAAPRVVTLDYTPAEISIMQNEAIGGQVQEVGLRLSIFPIQSGPDGGVDLGVIMRLTEPITTDPGQGN